jgi:hypothetical protein
MFLVMITLQGDETRRMKIPSNQNQKFQESQQRGNLGGAKVNKTILGKTTKESLSEAMD